MCLQVQDGATYDAGTHQESAAMDVNFSVCAHEQEVGEILLDEDND